MDVGISRKQSTLANVFVIFIQTHTVTKISSPGSGGMTLVMDCQYQLLDGRWQARIEGGDQTR